MGRTAVHTEKQVFEAADQLAANRQEVTPNALRDLLGRGSYSTFVKHIDAWQQARQAAPAPVIIDMPESVKAAFAQTWQAAATEAGKEIAAIRDKADAEISAVKRRLDEAVAAIEQLESEAEADSAKLEAAESSLSTERTASQQAATLAIAREAALQATADQMREQIEAQQVELGRVHAEAEAARGQHATEITRLTGDFSRQLAEQSNALRASQGEADRLRGQLADAGEKLDATSARERAKVEEAATAKAEAARLADQLKDQKARSLEVIGKLEKAKQSLDAEITALRKEARALVAQGGRAAGELDALRAQVAAQNGVIKGFSPASDKKTK